MPGKYYNGDDIHSIPRPIHSDLKSKRIIWEPEHPFRWSFMKVLREYSTLKEFYPEINPYTEVYKVRDNTWALYNDSFDGAGDVWMYLIDGPEKCMIVDTSFGIGDLKSLIRHLVGDKEIEEKNLSVRRRSGGDMGSMEESDFTAMALRETAEKVIW